MRPGGMTPSPGRALARRARPGSGRLRALLLAVLTAGMAVPVSAAGPDPVSAAGPDPAAPLALTTPAQQPASCASSAAMLDTSFARSILTSVVTDGVSAWAVGMTTLTEDPRYALAVRWDGRGWPEMPMRRPKSEQALFAIDRGPGGSLWAAGYRNSGGGYRPMLMHWTGGRWIPVRLGASGRRTGVLTGIDALTDQFVWAVGYRSVRGGQRPFALRHDAAGWSESDPPLGGGTDGALMDVNSAAGGGSTWAVGWVTARGVPHPYAVQRTRGRWRTSRPDLPRGAEGVLTSVAVEPSGRAWAVGYRVASGRYVPLVQRWDGRRWRNIGFPLDGTDIALLRGVQLDSHGQPVIAGTRWDAGLREWRGIVGQRASGRWRLTDVPLLDGGTELRDVAGGPDGEALAVGANGRRSLALGVCADQGLAEPTASPGPGASGPPPPVGSHAPTLPSASPLRSAEPSAPAEPSAGPTPTAVAFEPAGAGPSTAPATTAPATPSPAPASPIASPRASRPPAKASPLPRRDHGYRIVARDVARTVGLDLETSTYGAVRADFDRDGWADLFIGRHSNPGLMVVNRGGQFVPAPGVDIRRQDRHGCTAGDANGDGRMDLFCALGSLHGAGMKTDELWIQQSDGTFLDQAVAMRAADPVGRGRLALFFDLDHDRYADLFIADRPDRTDGLPSRHRVLANPSGSRFEIAIGHRVRRRKWG